MDIPSVRQKIQQEAVNPNSPVSQYLFNQLGGAVNEMLDGLKRSAEFTTAGSHSWTSPLDGYVLLEAVGGGGGGGTYGGGSPPYGPGGGAGCKKVFKMYPVTKNTVYSITVGAGGAGAPNGGAGVGGTGGATIFDGVTIALGAAGGSTASGSLTNGLGGAGSSVFNKGGDGLATGSLGGAAAYFTTLANIDRFGAENSETFSGGAYGGNNGGGGASSYGNGGAGSVSGTGQAGQGYGAGGGASGNTGAGGDGASGYLAIYYV